MSYLSIDFEASLTANKALIVIFIIAIVLINCFLILLTVRKGGFLYTPRSLTIISLAIGDIFLALFAFSVLAEMFYSNFLSLSCATLSSALVYRTFLIHFVYAVGLIVLAVEFVHRYKNQISFENTIPNIVKSIICSAVPWFLGLIIVLPITMADTDLEIGKIPVDVCIYATTERYIAMYGITVVLPVSLAAIACIVTMCIRLIPVNHAGHVIGYQGTTQGVVISVNNTSNMPQQYPINIAGNMQPILTGPPPPPAYYSNTNNQNYKLGAPEFNPVLAQYPPPQHHYQQHLPQQQMSQPNVVVSSPVFPTQSQTNPVSSLINPAKERLTLLRVSILLFLCVIPLAAQTMGILDSLSYDDTDYILQQIFLWMTNLRPILTPLIWIGYLRN